MQGKSGRMGKIKWYWSGN